MLCHILFFLLHDRLLTAMDYLDTIASCLVEGHSKGEPRVRRPETEVGCGNSRFWMRISGMKITAMRPGLFDNLNYCLIDL